MAASAALVITGKTQLGNFVGQWAPSLLVIGLYNKLVKEISPACLAAADERRST